MNELRETLSAIENTYNMDISNDEKYNIVADLWTKYYTLKQKLGVEIDDDVNIRLMYENACYKVDQGPDMTIPNNDIVIESLKKLDTALKNAGGISNDDAHNILKYVVYYTRRNLSYLGVNINEHSMNGFCELAQSLSIRALEQLGLPVTKNLAEDDFNYDEHHAFGTVTFPIMENNDVVMKPYLIDITYRQFFTSTRCHDGIFHINEDGLYKKPDPGYFVRDEEFAKELMREGYIELTLENAYLYGIPFALSGYALTRSTNYYEKILNDKNDYVLKKDELEGLTVNFPDYNKYRL